VAKIPPCTLIKNIEITHLVLDFSGDTWKDLKLGVVLPAVDKKTFSFVSNLDDLVSKWY
jgi:hypothetical protein